MIKRYVRHKNGLIYDRLGKRSIKIKSQRLIGGIYYIVPEGQATIIISKEDIEE